MPTRERDIENTRGLARLSAEPDGLGRQLPARLAQPIAAVREPLALLVLVLSVLLAGCGGSDAAAPWASIPRSALRIDVGTRAISRPVPPGFIGVSVEYPSLASYAGPDPAAPNPLFGVLLRALTPGGAPVIRVGGDTTDWTWWPTPGVATPPGIRFTLTPAWVDSVGAAVRAMGARLILGINFEADSTAIARTEADELLAGLGRSSILGFELGNEPEVYGALGWYTNSAGVGVPGRPHGYDFSDFLPDYAHVAAALPTSVPLVGPASGAPTWLAGLGTFLDRNPRVRLATFHRYPLHRCFTARNAPTYPTIPNLLAPVSASGPAQSLAAAVAVAHAHGVPLRSDELNSVSCGGAHGVSDTFASALWALDTLFWMARVGVDGVNIHTFKKAIYEPFAFSHAGGAWSAEVKPLYYGLLMFTRAAPAGSRLLSVSGRSGAALRVWATRARDGSVRVLAINDSPRVSRTLALALPGGAGSAATVIRLRAPSLHARGGVSLGGQSFGPRTSTGALAGGAVSAKLTAIDGRYVVQVPAASAALLTVAG